MSKSKLQDSSKIKGFFRINVLDYKDGAPEVVGDTGWVQNTITNGGYSNFIIGALIAANSSAMANPWFALGTGTASIASNATSLVGELTISSANRFGANTAAAATAGITGTKTYQVTGSLNSGVLNTTAAIADIGLFAASAVTAGTMICGNTYTASTLQTNQSVNATYQIVFG